MFGKRTTFGGNTPGVGEIPRPIPSAPRPEPAAMPGAPRRGMDEGGAQRAKTTDDVLDVRAPAGPILLHGHCHLKALVGTEPLVAFLKKLGGNVTLLDSGCCGMAGSFGYEKEHYDISLQMAERRLAPAAREASDSTTVVAPGTSCRHQIHDTAGRRALHPAEVAARAMGLSF